MYVKEGFRQLLVETAEIAALVDGRVYAPVLPQTVIYPALAYRQVGGTEDLDLDGSIGFLALQFRVFAAATKASGDYTMASQVGEAVRRSLNGYRGFVLGDDSPPTGIRFQLITALSTFDVYDDRTQTHQVITDFTVRANGYLPT